MGVVGSDEIVGRNIKPITVSLCSGALRALPLSPTPLPPGERGYTEFAS